MRRVRVFVFGLLLLVPLLARAAVPASDGSPAAEATAAPATPAAPGLQPAGPRPLPPIPRGAVSIVRIDGTIDLGLSPFVARVLKDAKKGQIVVLDVNTLGGRLDAGLTIRDAILGSKATTVCWIHPRAISAGALICLGADVIAISRGGTIGAATPVQIQGGKMEPVEAKVVSYMRKEMAATLEAKGRPGVIGEAMVDRDVAVPGLIEKGKLLTMDAEQALHWGVASFKADDETALFAGLGIPTPDRISRPTLSWAEKVARVLSDPVLSGILMTLGMLGILIELYTGGHGAGLIVGLTCLGLFFFGHLVVKLAGWEDVALFVVGIMLVGIEVFIPGHILPGVLGALAILASLVLALVNLQHVPLDVAWAAGWITNAMATVFAAIIVTATLGWGLGKLLPRTPFGRPLMLQTALPNKAQEQARLGLTGLVGMTGTVVTALRPAGKVQLEGKRFDAVAERGYIEPGREVKVLRVERHRVVVKEVPAEPGPTTGEGA